jgi:hypothetical protein
VEGADVASLGDYLDELVVDGTSPDGHVRARVRDYTSVEVSFRPGALEHYDEERLSYQLGRLALTTWVAYHRARSEAYRRARNLSTEELAAAELPNPDPHVQRYEAELNRIEAEGISAGRAVEIRTRGMMEWDVHVRAGAIEHLGEERLLQEIHSAMSALLRDRELKIIVLKGRYFDLGVPRQWRTAMDELQELNARQQP